AAIRADAQLAPRDPGAADPGELLLAELATDLDQGERAEDRDLADVLAAQAALTGDGADDRRRSRPVGVAHTDAVGRVIGLGVRAGARAARSALLASTQGGAGDLLVLGAGAGTVVAHGHRTEDRGHLERIHPVLGDEALDRFAVQLETAALGALGDTGEQGG